MIRADVLFIGYRRAGTNFLVNYFRNHPQINHDDQCIADLMYHPNLKPTLVDKPKGKVYISCDESITESVCVTGRPEVWGRYLYHPGCFNLVRYDVMIDAKEAARRVSAVFPNAKVLMILRNQVDWFASLYKSSISSLPPNQRSFHDWWLTPDGIACRYAGYHDQIIKAWAHFDTMIIRCEQLVEPGISHALCRWLGVDHIPFDPGFLNESHAGLAWLHFNVPFLSSLPLGVKSALKPLAMMLPGKRKPVLSPSEATMILELYKESNERTRTLLNA